MGWSVVWWVIEKENKDADEEKNRIQKGQKIEFDNQAEAVRYAGIYSRCLR